MEIAFNDNQEFITSGWIEKLKEVFRRTEGWDDDDLTGLDTLKDFIDMVREIGEYEYSFEEYTALFGEEIMLSTYELHDSKHLKITDLIARNAEIKNKTELRIQKNIMAWTQAFDGYSKEELIELLKETNCPIKNK